MSTASEVGKVKRSTEDVKETNENPFGELAERSAKTINQALIQQNKDKAEDNGFTHISEILKKYQIVINKSKQLMNMIEVHNSVLAEIRRLQKEIDETGIAYFTIVSCYGDDGPSAMIEIKKSKVKFY